LSFGSKPGAVFSAEIASIVFGNIYDLLGKLGIPRVLTPHLVWFLRYPFVQLPFEKPRPIVENLVDKSQTKTSVGFYGGWKSKL